MQTHITQHPQQPIPDNNMQKEITIPSVDMFYDYIKHVNDFLSSFFVSILHTKYSKGFLSITTCDKNRGYGLNMNNREDYIYKLNDNDVCKFYEKMAIEAICSDGEINLGGNDRNLWISLVLLSFPGKFIDDFIKSCEYNTFLSYIQQYLSNINIKYYVNMAKKDCPDFYIIPFTLSPCLEVKQILGGDSPEYVMYDFVVEHYSCCYIGDFKCSLVSVQRLFDFFKENGHIEPLNSVGTEFN